MDVASESELRICLEQVAEQGPVECLVSETVVKRTSGSGSIGAVYSVTLPTSRRLDAVVRFVSPVGCFVWDHSGAEPTGTVDLLRINAPSGVIAGSRVRFVDLCVEERRSGVLGGGVTTSVRAVVATGNGLGEIELVESGSSELRVNSSGAGTVAAFPGIAESSAAADQFAVCKAGKRRGGGYSPETGLYDWTCAGPAWTTGETFVECDGEASTATGDDGRCWAAGERLMVDETLEAFMLAHDATIPGGTIYAPLWPGKDHAIYVYEECDGGTCPLIQQNFDDVRKNQPNRTVFITGTHGRRFVAESSPRVDPITKRRSGVWLVDNSNDGAVGTGNWVFRTGLQTGVRLCIPTSATDPTCNVAAAELSQITQPTMSLTGVETDLVLTTTPTTVNAGYTTMCIENTITADHSTTAGVCSGDPRIRCTVAGDSNRLTILTGGCDFGVGGDLGACVGIGDYLEDRVEDENEDLYLAMMFGNVLENGTTASPNGSRTTIMPVESVVDALCNTDDRTIRLGISHPTDILSRQWPFDHKELNPANLTTNRIWIVDRDAMDLGRGFTFENFGFAPNNYFSRDSSLASADCITGAEAECDERSLIGFLGGIGGGHRNTLYWGCSNDTAQSCIDGTTAGLETKIHDWESDYLRQGLLADLSRWDFLRGYVHDSATTGGLFQMFVSNTRIGDLYLRNNRANFAFENAYAKSLTIENVIVEGFYAENALIRITSGQQIAVQDFDINGLSGHFAVIGAETEADVLAGLTFRNVKCVGNCAPVISTGFGEPSKSFISVTQTPTALNTAQGPIERINIDTVAVDSGLAEIMLLHLDIGDDNVTGGANATNLGQEPYFDQISLTNSSLNSTSGVLIGVTDSTTTNFDAGDIDVDYRDLTRQPRRRNNRLNGIAEPDWDYPQMTAVQAGDAENLAFGTVVSITDDATVGGCGHTAGVLNGGGTAMSVCKANPNSGGSWTAY